MQKSFVTVSIAIEPNSKYRAPCIFPDVMVKVIKFSSHL